MATAVAAQRGRLTAKAAEAMTRSKARLIATCVLVRRTGLIESAIAPPTFWSVSREVVWDRFAETRTSVFLTGDLGHPQHVLGADGRGGHEEAVGVVLADKPTEIGDVAHDSKPVRWAGRPHMADRGEARGWIREVLCQSTGISCRADDQGPETEPPVPLQPQAIGLPPAACPELQEEASSHASPSQTRGNAALDQ